MSTTIEKPSRIDVIGASAGTGKTTRLTKEFVDAVIGGSGNEPVPADSILVCTFTNKAADELGARIRTELIAKGEWESAQQVTSGYVGTVNSICGRLLKDFAFEAGLSPMQSVIPDEMQKVVFNIAATPILDDFGERIDPIAIRLSYNETSRRGAAFDRSKHWSEFVKEICDIARANNITPAALAQCAEKSSSNMLMYFQRVLDGETTTSLNSELQKGLEASIEALRGSPDETKTTKQALYKLTDMLWKAKRHELSWKDWADLAKIDVAKRSQDLIVDLKETAAKHPRHPQLHDDVREFTALIFECAAQALSSYQRYKDEAGLIDFTDQEYKVLSLLDVPDVQDALKDRLKVVLVDEFQDTSPIQLALFLKLSALANRSIWVGDVKQAIYGFRGTDPELMKTCSSYFCKLPPLDTCYRSQEELVTLSNEVFGRVFANHGMAREDIVIRAHRTNPDADKPPNLEWWHCGGNNLGMCYERLAAGIVDLLGRTPAFMIDDGHGGKRRIQGSDVAVLCRTQDRADAVANALSDVGVKVAIRRKGLLDTPECALAFAAFRYLVDRNDTLAAAEIVHFTHDHSKGNQADWLTAWLSSEDARELTPELVAVGQARKDIASCSITDVLHVALDKASTRKIIAGWGDFRLRLSNIEAFFGVVNDYENGCAMAHSAATPAGFIKYVYGLSDVERPASRDIEAVQILTYHRSKGLEWPVVVLTDLDKAVNLDVARDVCAVAVEASPNPFDISDPLADRWLRLWPWPYGGIKTNVHADTTLLNSPEAKRTHNRLLEENLRLMYVGFTRARDMLILAPYTGRKNSSGYEWLDELRHNDLPLLTVGMTDEVATIDIDGTAHRFAIRCLDQPATVQATVFQETFLPPVVSQFGYLSYFIRPSEAVSSEAPRDREPTVIDIGDRIAITGSVNMGTLGDCVHRFLAADDASLPRGARLEVAERLRSLWSVSQIRADDMLKISDRLQLFLKSRYDSFVAFPEFPIAARIGNQRLRGFIDLLVETDNELHVIDHKSFPGAMDKWVTKSLTFEGQLQAYSAALSNSGDKPVGDRLIHLPIVGKIVQL